MHKLALAEEFDRLLDVGIVNHTQDVVIGYASLLLCCKVFVEVGEDIALNADIFHIGRHACGAGRVDARGVVGKIGCQGRFFDLLNRKISGQLIENGTDHLKMPELISSEYEVQLSDEERKHYDELKQDLVLTLGDGEITASNAASLSGKLSQMANGAIYDDDGNTIHIHDRKLDALEDIIEAANGKPLLVAYWFKHDLARIEERLHNLHIPFSRLDDSVSIRRWNNGEIPVALIHPASAGHGLNLQSGGSTIVWFGLTWSLELYQQTVARLWRQGQTASTVVVQHIVTKGTIDNRIMKALSQKEHVQTALIDAVKADLKI